MNTHTSQKPIIVIVGPTSAGKSDVAVFVAKKINGAVISADSRQVYTGMDIGSGKISKKEMCGVPHYGLDIANPKKVFTAHDFQKYAQKKVAEIIMANKIPIICGGTGFYIDIALGRMTTADIPPNQALRKKLSHHTPVELYAMLKKADPIRAKNIDANNSRRLIRALEIAHAQKTSKKSFSDSRPSPLIPNHSLVWIGITKEKTELHRRIEHRLKKRWPGILRETRILHKNGVSWKRLYDLGLEYRYSSLALQKKLSKKDAYTELCNAIKHYAKRQMTWFKRNKEIVWVSSAHDAINIINATVKK